MAVKNFNIELLFLNINVWIDFGKEFPFYLSVTAFKFWAVYYNNFHIICCMEEFLTVFPFTWFHFEVYKSVLGSWSTIKCL